MDSMKIQENHSWGKQIHEKYLLLEKAEMLMLPSQSKEQGIEFVMSGLPVTKEQATQLVETVLRVNGL